MSEKAIYEIRLKDQFSSPLGGLESKMNRFESHVSGLNNSFKGLGGTIAGAFAGGAVVSAAESLIGGLYNIGEEAVQVARNFTNMKDAISFASGPDAAKNISFLNYEVDRLGLNVESTYKGFKVFQGALMGTSLEGDKGREIFEAVSEAASVMKLSAEQTEGTFLALGQMISKGNVQAEELRGQLGERLPGAFQIFARSLGVSTSKLNDMLKDGEVLAEDSLPKFAAELRKTFSPGVAKAQGTFNANMNRFQNFVLRSKIALGEGLMPYINELIVAIPKLDFSPLLFTVSQLKDQVFGLAGAFKDLFATIGISFTTLDALTFVLKYIGYLFRVAWTPIRWGLELYNQFINVIKNSMGILQGLGKFFGGMFTRNFTMAAEGIDQLKNSFAKLADGAGKSASKFWSKEKEGWAKIFGSPDDVKPSASAGWNPFGSAYSSISGGGAGSMSSAGGKNKTGEAGVEKIQSGTRNITVNINKLIETVKFDRTNGQSETQLMEMIKKALVTAVNDVNIVAQ